MGVTSLLELPKLRRYLKTPATLGKANVGTSRTLSHLTWVSFFISQVRKHMALRLVM